MKASLFSVGIQTSRLSGNDPANSAAKEEISLWILLCDSTAEAEIRQFGAGINEHQQRYGNQTERLELSNSVGWSWTKEEKEAGADATRVLKAGDPVPQTVFYSPDAKSGDPLLVNLRLPYGNGGMSKQLSGSKHSAKKKKPAGEPVSFKRDNMRTKQEQQKETQNR